MKATAERYPAKVKAVVLTMDEHEYSRLIACLESHSQNDIDNGRVVNCGTAASLLHVIRSAVDAAQTTP